MSCHAQPPAQPARTDAARAGDDALFIEEVDTRAGSVWAQGELTARSADMLGDAVDVLRRVGHSRIVVDLHGLHPVDDAGARAIRSLQRAVTAAGGQVTLPLPRDPQS